MIQLDFRPVYHHQFTCYIFFLLYVDFIFLFFLYDVYVGNDIREENPIVSCTQKFLQHIIFFLQFIEFVLQLIKNFLLLFLSPLLLISRS